MEMSGQLHAPVALPPGKEHLLPIRQGAGWAPEPFWTRWFLEKFPAPAGNRTPIVHLVAQRYTDIAFTAVGSAHVLHIDSLRCRTAYETLTTYILSQKNRDSSVGIAPGYGLDGRGSRVRFPAGAGNFSLHHHDQNGSGAHPASNPMSTRSSFPGGKAASS
jgi:hypothetical protein